MALTPSLVDIFLGSLSQVQSERSGPIGRLLTAKNVIARQFDPGAQPQRIALKQRNGFTAYSTDLRSALDGSSVDSTGKWDNPEMLTALDAQPVSIANAIPRVWNGTSWSYYGDTRAVTNKLAQDVVHTSNHTIQASTQAVLNGVTCFVWTESTISNALPVTGVYISVRAADGAWLRTPQLLYGDPTTNDQTLAKVVADPTIPAFWVFFNKVGLGGPKIAVHLYDLNGQLIATTEIVRNDPTTPGFFDATFLTEGPVDYFVSPNSVQYGGVGTGGPGTWLIPTASFLPSSIGGTFTISGDPAGGVNGTYTITGYTSPTVVTATPNATPTLSFTIPGASATSFGGDTWNFPATSTLPIGATVVITGSAVPALDGTYTVLTWDSGSHIATMSPTTSSGGTVGSGGSVVVTYAADLPYTLDAGDVIEVQYDAPARVLLAQPFDPVTPTTGVDYSVLTPGTFGTIDESRVTDHSTACIGALSFVTNKIGDNLGYLATLAGGEGDQIIGWQTTGAGQTHEFDTGYFVDPTNAKYVDSFVGWSEPGTNPNQPSLNVGITLLANGATSDAGPIYDPALRQMFVFNVDFANTPTFLKQIDGLVPVSRAFEHDGEWYVFTYYQSGSGLVITPESETVTIDDGIDYMTGAAIQNTRVAAGDYTTGAPFASVGYDSVGAVRFSAEAVTVSLQQTVSIAASDTVQPVLSTDAATTVGSLAPFPFAQPITVLKWNIAAMLRFSLTQNIWGSLLVVSGSSGVSGADGEYYIVGWDLSAGIFYTLPRLGNGALPNGTFAHAGTTETRSMVIYNTVPNTSLTSDKMQTFYVGGNITVTGSGTADGSKTIDHVLRGSAPYWPAGCPDMWSVVRTTEAATSAIFNATVSPATPGKWSFAFGTTFDASLVGSNLVVSGDTIPTNNGPFTITGAFTGELDTADPDASALQPEFFPSPPPTITVNLDVGVQPYTFSFNNITVDFSYQDATIIVQGSPTDANNTQYKVYDVNVTANLLYATPDNGGSPDQLSQLFRTGVETVTIIKSSAIVQPWQPTFFMTPLTGVQAQVGRFDNAIAYADWRIEGDTVLGPNEFPMAIGDVCDVAGGIQVCLPYRAQNVTSNLPVATVRGQINLAGANITANTVGL